MATKKILELATTMQSAALLGENVKACKMKKLEVDDITSLGVKNIVGTALLKEQANIIGKL